MPKLPLKVLIVEDEALIALLIEDALLAAGYTPCGVASSESEALRLVEVERPGFAVVDINLGAGGSGLVVGQELGVRGVAVLCASGHCPDLKEEMSRTGARACLRKPYSPTSWARPWKPLRSSTLAISRACYPRPSTSSTNELRLDTPGRLHLTLSERGRRKMPPSQ
jgi:DNA-binding response OmpR family regulator